MGSTPSVGTISQFYYGVLDHEPKYEKAIVDRSVANMESFKNHASVIMWLLGNECGGGSNFVSAVKAAKSLDTSRPVHYEPFGIGANNPADVDSRVYTGVSDVEKIATDGKYTKPFYMGVYQGIEAARSPAAFAFDDKIGADQTNASPT